MAVAPNQLFVAKNQKTVKTSMPDYLCRKFDQPSTENLLLSEQVFNKLTKEQLKAKNMVAYRN
jgi:hypothetical protein